MNSTSAHFGFSGPTKEPPNGGYECSLDGSAFAACGSGPEWVEIGGKGPVADAAGWKPSTAYYFWVDYENLAEGSHSFEVRAVVDGVPGRAAKRTWTIDLTPPATPVITHAPESPGRSWDVFFWFDTTEGFTECKLDSEPYSHCRSHSEQRYQFLPEGRHTFSVRRVDRAGNASAATTHAWTIDNAARVRQDATTQVDKVTEFGAGFNDDVEYLREMADYFVPADEVVTWGVEYATDFARNFLYPYGGILPD